MESLFLAIAGRRSSCCCTFSRIRRRRRRHRRPRRRRREYYSMHMERDNCMSGLGTAKALGSAKCAGLRKGPANQSALGSAKARQMETANESAAGLRKGPANYSVQRALILVNGGRRKTDASLAGLARQTRRAHGRAQQAPAQAHFGF